MKSLVAQLKKTPNLKGWQVHRLRKDSSEVYFVHDVLETVRCNTVNNYTLHIQTPAEADFMGESTARFQGKIGSLKELVAETIQRAHLVKNPAYNFAAPYEKSQTTTEYIHDMDVADAELEELIGFAQKMVAYRKAHLRNYPLNSMEIFFEEYNYAIENHLGLSVEKPSTRIVCDYVLTSPDNQHEIMGIKKRRYLSDLTLEEEWENDASILSDLTRAVLPPTGNFPVVLSGEALDSLFDFFIAQLDGHALFNRYSLFQKDDEVVRDAKEPLAIFSEAKLAGGMRSYVYDGLGYPMKSIALIQDTRVANFLLDGRYADLLKLPQTSSLANTRVVCGGTPYADFLSGTVLELSKFSTFQPNTISGAFSGEIRLGYLYKGGKKIPIKGGSVSGTTQKAFQRAFKSKEEVKRASYIGPKGVFFENLTIAGAV